MPVAMVPLMDEFGLDQGGSHRFVVGRWSHAKAADSRAKEGTPLVPWRSVNLLWIVVVLIFDWDRDVLFLVLGLRGSYSPVTVPVDLHHRRNYEKFTEFIPT